MDTPEILTTIAEVAVAVTGFTAIAAVFRRIRQDEWSNSERLHALVLIRTSVIVLFFSFAPWVFGQLPISADSAWRISAGLFGVANLIDIAWYLRHASGTPTTKVQSALAVMGMVNVCCQFLVAVGLLANAPLVFVVGLIFLLYVSVHNFVLLLVIGLTD